jgi:type IV pilus assembly protein PilW
MNALSKPGAGSGMSLLELVIAMAISSALTLTLVNMAIAARSSFRLQEGLAELQENSRYFEDLLSSTIAESAYHPKPWLHDLTPIGLMQDSADGIAEHSDRVITRSWSERNCFGTPNTQTDGSGRPAFYLKESLLELNNGSLAHTCRYGADGNSLTTQINRQGALPQVEAFQVLYATDMDLDGNPEGWLKAGDWQSSNQVVALRLALLSSSRESLAEKKQENFRVLDHEFSAPADGRLRRLITYTLPNNRNAQ